MALVEKPLFRRSTSISINRFVNLRLQICRQAGPCPAPYSFIALGSVPC
jgi:hypothetical protein